MATATTSPTTARPELALSMPLLRLGLPLRGDEARGLAQRPAPEQARPGPEFREIIHGQQPGDEALVHDKKVYRKRSAQHWLPYAACPRKTAPGSVSQTVSS